jgi:hypothetical protein
MNRLLSANAVNEEQRKIARDMDDVKQQERSIAETPKRRQVAAMIDDAERTRHITAEGDEYPSLPR